MEVRIKTYTFAFAFENNGSLKAQERVLWKDLHRQKSSTRSECWDLFRYSGKKETNRHRALVRFRKNQVLDYNNLGDSFWTDYRHSRNRIYNILQWRVWSWLRMNASYRLNTCKSRGNKRKACFSCWRPAHGWVTRIQPTYN